MDYLSRSQRKIIVYAIAAALLARVFFTFITPIDSWGTDSSLHAEMGKIMAVSGLIPTWDPLAVDFYHWTPPLYHFMETGLYLITHSIESFKLISLFFGILTVPLCYITFLPLIGRDKSLLASFFLAVYPVHIRLSTSIITDGIVLFFSFLALHLFLSFERKRSLELGLMLAAVLGLMLLSKYSGLAIIIVLYGWILLKRIPLRPYLPILLIAVIIAAPWYVHNYFESGDPFSMPYLEHGTLAERVQTMAAALQPKSLNDYYMRFWDSIDPGEFAYRGIPEPPMVRILLLLFSFVGLPYFLFFAAGVSVKLKFDRFMLFWLLVYLLFSLYYLMSGWGANFLPRVGIWALPMFCYLFANGICKLKRFMPLVVVFLLLSGMAFVGFAGVKLYTKNNSEKLFDPSYDWIKSNTPQDAIFVSYQSVQIPLFSERRTTLVFPSDAKNVYIYNRFLSATTVACPAVCELVYNDTAINIFKIS